MNALIEQLEERIGKKIARNELLQSQKKESIVAKNFVIIEKSDELIKIVTVARELTIPFIILGGGNEKIPTDNTLVIKNNCRRFDKISLRGKVSGQAIGVSEVLVQAEAGTPMNQLVRFTIEEGLHGLEYQLGMQGTVGEAIWTNAGYKRNKVWDSLQAIRLLSEDGTIGLFQDNFKKHLENGILLSAIFQLIPASTKVLWERGNEAVAYRIEKSKV